MWCWYKILGGVDVDFFYGVVEVLGGFVVVGYIKFVGVGDSDVWVMKVLVDGEVIWFNVYGGEVKDWVCGLVVFFDGFIVVVGFFSLFGV